MYKSENFNGLIINFKVTSGSCRCIVELSLLNLAFLMYLSADTEKM